MSQIARTRGDTYPIDMVIKRNGAPVDLTGATVVLTVDPSKNPVDDTGNLFQSVAVLGSSTGEVQFPISDLAADHVGRFWYDVQITVGGLRRTIGPFRYIMTQDIAKN